MRRLNLNFIICTHFCIVRIKNFLCVYFEKFLQILKELPNLSRVTINVSCAS